MKNKAIWIIIIILIVLAVAVVYFYNKSNLPMQTSEPSPISATPDASNGTQNNAKNIINFSGVEGNFTALAYFGGGLPMGTHSVTLIKGKTSVLSFSEKILKINNVQIELGIHANNNTKVHIVDIDANDDYYEVLICKIEENDYLTNTVYRYNGRAITPLASFDGPIFFNEHGKVVMADNQGGKSQRISSPMITRSYYEFRYSKFERVDVPIKNKNFTFSTNIDDLRFNFYETPNVPTSELANSLLNQSEKNKTFAVKDFAGKKFTILDYSEVTQWNSGAWYYVQLEDGRKGIIYWWYAG